MEDIDYLVETYLLKEDWHQSKLDETQARVYFQKLIEGKNVVVMREGERPIGYLSVWFLDNDQASRVLSKKPMHAADENLTDGEIVFVSNAFVEERYRNKGNIKRLNQMMKDQHEGRDYAGIIYQDGYNKGEFSFYKKGEI
jgi:hypothetical protein